MRDNVTLLYYNSSASWARTCSRVPVRRSSQLFTLARLIAAGKCVASIPLLDQVVSCANFLCKQA